MNDEDSFETTYFLNWLELQLLVINAADGKNIVGIEALGESEEYRKRAHSIIDLIKSHRFCDLVNKYGGDNGS